MRAFSASKFPFPKNLIALLALVSIQPVLAETRTEVNVKEANERQAFIEHIKAKAMSDSDTFSHLMLLDVSTKRDWATEFELNHPSQDSGGRRPPGTPLQEHQLLSEYVGASLEDAMMDYAAVQSHLKSGGAMIRNVERLIELVGIGVDQKSKPQVGKGSGIGLTAKAAKPVLGIFKDAMMWAKAQDDAHSPMAQHRLATTEGYLDQAALRLWEAQNDPTMGPGYKAIVFKYFRVAREMTTKQMALAGAQWESEQAAKAKDSDTKARHELAADMYRTIANGVNEDGSLKNLTPEQMAEVERLAKRAAAQAVKDAEKLADGVKNEPQLDAETRKELQKMINEAAPEALGHFANFAGKLGPAGRDTMYLLKGTLALQSGVHQARTLMASGMKGAGKAAGLKVAGAIFAALDFFSMLFGGESEFSILRKEIAELKDAVQKLGEYVEYRFNITDRRIGELTRFSAENFDVIRRHLSEISANVATIQKAQAAADQQSRLILQKVAGIPSTLAQSELDLSVVGCLDYHANNKTKMSDAALTACLDQFYTCATKSAKTVFLDTPGNYTSFEQMYSELAGYGINRENAPRFLRLIEKHADQVLPPTVEDQLQRKDSVNIGIWSLCASGYHDLVSRYHEDYLRLRTDSQLEQLTQMSKDIPLQIAKLGEDRDVALPSGITKRSLIDTTFSNYQRALKDFLDGVRDVEAALIDRPKDEAKNVQAPTGQIVPLGLNGYNPWLGIDQPVPLDPSNPKSTRFANEMPTTIQICRGDSIIAHSKGKPGPDGQWKLPLSTEERRALAEAIPAELRMAHQLKQGVITFCYDDVDWQDVEQGDRVEVDPAKYGMPGKWANMHRKFGRAGLRLRVLWNGWPIAKADALAKDRTEFGWYGAHSGETRVFVRDGSLESRTYYSGSSDDYPEGVLEKTVSSKLSSELFPDAIAKLKKEFVNLSQERTPAELALKFAPANPDATDPYRELGHRAGRAGLDIIKTTEVEDGVTRTFVAVRPKYQKEFDRYFFQEQSRDARERVLTDLRLHRAAIFQKVRDEMSPKNLLHGRAVALDVHRSLLEAQFALAFPESSTDSQLLRKLFGNGSSSLPTSGDILSLLSGMVAHSLDGKLVPVKDPTFGVLDFSQLNACAEKGMGDLSHYSSLSTDFSRSFVPVQRKLVGTDTGDALTVLYMRARGQLDALRECLAALLSREKNPERIAYLESRSLELDLLLKLTQAMRALPPTGEAPISSDTAPRRKSNHQPAKPAR